MTTVDTAGARLERLFHALPHLVGREDVPVEEIRALAGVDALTLLDDLRALTEREDDPGGYVETVSILFEADRVSVHSPHFGRPMRLTLPELCALELGLAMLGASHTDGRSHIDGARERIRKAIVAMPESAARDDLWYATGPAVANEGVMSTLRAGVSRAVKVRIVYRRGDSTESTERVVHPYAVVPLRGAWFLFAYCERSGAVRIFRVDRVLSAESLGANFKRPADFDIEKLLTAGRAVGSGTGERLVVRYSPQIARWIAEREEGDWGADGSLTVSHPLADDAWAVRHVLQYGTEAEVVRPESIREAVRARLLAMATPL